MAKQMKLGPLAHGAAGGVHVARGPYGKVAGAAGKSNVELARRAQKIARQKGRKTAVSAAAATRAKIKGA